MDNETGTPSTESDSAPTEQGKAAQVSGSTDPTVSGLSKRLNQEIAARQAAEAKLAETAAAAEEARQIRRENAVLKKTKQYADVSPALEKIFEKGVDPDIVDDDFVSALRMGAGAPPKENLDTPSHNTARNTSQTTPSDILKKMTAEEFWGES